MLETASQNIKIIPEATTETEEFNLAFDELQTAEKICFLGFGYHETNMTRLRLKELEHDANVSGTIYGLSAQGKNMMGNIGIKKMEILYFEKFFFDDTVYQFLKDKVVFG